MPGLAGQDDLTVAGAGGALCEGRKTATAVKRSSENGNHQILSKIDWKVSFK